LELPPTKRTRAQRVMQPPSLEVLQPLKLFKLLTVPVLDPCV
jgi:hypothetical protein